MSTELPVSSLFAIDADNPWPGLATFTEDQRAYFHGRDEEILDLTQLAERRPLVVLFGQSGLGKSSILQAGVFPRLRTDGFCPIYIRLDHGEGAPPPTEQIKEMVRIETAKSGTWTKPDAARPGETLWEYFHHRDDRLIDRDGLGVVPVLVFDQFEELFTLGAARGERRERALAFIRELAELVENRPSAQLVARLDRSSEEMESFDFGRTDYRVIISLREDFLPDLETLKTIMPALMQKRMRLARMTGTQALEAVLKPGGALVTPEVARAIVEFVAGARGGSVERLAELDVEPALLSVICRELNERRRSLGQTQITVDLVTGNRREILTDFYERSVADLPAPMRGFVEDRLLTKSGFRDNLALETALEEPGVTQPLIDTLVARRLLRIEDRGGVQRVELTHDVLAEVIRASRDARQQRRALEEARQREQLALAAVARQTRRQRVLLGGLVLAVFALCVGALFGLRAQRRAAILAGEAELATGSRLLDEGQTGDGLAYLAAAARRDQGHSVAATRIVSTLAARNFLLPVGAPLTLPSPGTQAFILADGRSALVLCADSRVRVLDLAEWKVTREFSFAQKIQPEGLRVAAKNSDVFAVAFADGTVQVCDTATGRPRGKTITPPNLVEAFSDITLGQMPTAFALSPDGRWLMTMRATVAVFDTATGEERFHGEQLNYSMVSFDIVTYNPFSSDSSRLAIPSWELTGTLAPSLKAVKSASLLLSVPDGKVLVSRPFEDPWHADGAKHFSADGARVLMLSWTGAGATKEDTDRTAVAFVCDASTLQPLGPAIPFVKRSDTVVLTPDGNRVVITLEGDRAARVYDVKTGRAAFPDLPQGAPFTGIGISEDSAVYATHTIDGQIRLWNLRTGAPFAESTFKLDRRGAAALSRDGRTVLVFSTTGAAYRLGITRSPAEPLVLPSAPVARQWTALPEKSPAHVLYLTNAAGTMSGTMFDIASGRPVGAPFALPGQVTSFIDRFRNEVTLRSGDVWLPHPDAGARMIWTWSDSGPPRETAFAEIIPVETTPYSSPMNASGTMVAFHRKDAGSVGASGGRSSTVELWDLRTGKKISQLESDGEALSLHTRWSEFSSDDQRLVVPTSPDQTAMRVFGVRDGKLRFQLAPEGSAAFRAVRFNRDGTRLVTGDTWGALQIWDGATGKLVQTIQAHRYWLQHIAFSRDGRYYASGSGDGTAQVRDAATHEPVGAALVHTGAVNNIQFSADNTRVATSTAAGAVRVWDLRTGLPLQDPSRYKTDNLPPDLGFSADGRFVLASFRTDDSRTTHLWSAPPIGPAERAPAWLLRLATVCAGRRLNESAKLESALDEFDRFDEVRREIAALPDDAPYATWAKWFLSTDPARSIAPGFTITPADAEKLAKELAAVATTPRP
jgi:WD40 repeat protein